MVVVDKLTCYAHFIPLRHPFTIAKVALAYMDNVFKLHSLPEIIVSDNDPIFTSRFWKELFSLIGTELCMSSAYHPKTNGQSQRVNQCLEIYLCCFTHACPSRWSHSSLWRSIGTTPVNTQRSRPHHLLLCMVMNHATRGLNLLRSAPSLHFKIGWKNAS
jgi:transposase InsO family protein